MKTSRVTNSQIMAALTRIDAGLPVPEICRELGISTATLDKWQPNSAACQAELAIQNEESIGAPKAGALGRA